MKKALSLFALPLFAVACSSHTSSPGGSGAGFTPFAAGPTTFSLSASIPASTEVFKCTYVQMPSTAGWVVGGEHQYTPGSHHLLLYKTDLSSIPAGEASPTVNDCYEGNADYMSHITGVVYPAATPNGGLTMPADVGLPFKANEIYLFQVHYLNAGATALNPQVQVHLDTTTTPVKNNAGVLFFYDPFIYVPQGSQGAKAGMRCPIKQDITMFTEGSHYHARGVNYQAYLDPSAAQQASTPFYTSNDWASPLIQLTTMQVKAGSFIRYYCDYDNTHGAQDFIQGQSAATNEMCMFVGMYYPAMDLNDEQCNSGDMFGQGSTACIDSLNCLQKCPSNTTGPLGVNFNECTQKCFVQSCPSTTAPLTTLLNCIQTKCPECGGSADGGQTACNTCVISSCGTEYGACSSDSCAAGSGPADGG